MGDILLWIPKYGHTQVGRPYKTYINQFALDTCMQFNYLQSLETNSQRGSGNLPNPVRSGNVPIVVVQEYGLSSFVMLCVDVC